MLGSVSSIRLRSPYVYVVFCNQVGYTSLGVALALEVEKFHMDSIICYWKMLRNTMLKMVNFEPFFEIQKDMAKQDF